MNRRGNWLTRIGAGLFVLWGVAHIIVGITPLVSFFTSGPAAMFAHAELKVQPSEVDAALNHAAHIVAEYYFNITALGILAIIVSVGLIWKNKPLGFWINLIVLGIADAAFFFLEILPGYQPILPPFPLMGVALYVLGSAFSGLGLLRRSQGGAEAGR